MGMMGSAVGSMDPSQVHVAHAQAQMGQMGSMGPGGDLKQFDAGKMKAGRLGHYGYLQGRGQFFLYSVAIFPVL